MTWTALLGALLCWAGDDELVANAGDCRLILQADVHIDGAPVAEVWQKRLRRIFDRLDRNRDGSLDPKEASFAPPPRLLLALWCGDLYNLGEPSPEDAESPKASVGWEEFWRRYHDAGVGRVEVHGYDGVSAYSTPLSDSLFTALTGDLEEPLTPEILAAANERLRRLDLDDNEWFDVAELSSASNGAKKMQRPTIFRTPSNSNAEPLQQDVRISDLVVDVNRATDSKAAERRFGNLRVEVAVDAERTNQLSQESKLVLAQQLDAIDFDNDNAVTLGEVSISPYTHLAPLFEVADLDGNEAMEVSERRWLLELVEIGANDHIVVSVLDHGRQLFVTLDADGDERLSRWELASGWRRLASWDRNQDGRLEWAEIETRIELTFGRGNPPRMDQTKANVAAKKTPAPDWFIAMDVNQDGSVSAREFLGPIEAFRRLDANADQLISLSELREPE